MKLTQQEKKILNDIKNLVNKRKNRFPKGEDMLSHNMNVEKFALAMSRHHKKVDIFPLLLAAHLHDIGLSETAGHDEHAVVGYELTKKYLKKYAFPDEQKELAALCALNHRGNASVPGRSLEEKIISSAAAMDFIDRALYLFTEKCKLVGYDNAVIWIKKILGKIMPRIELPIARRIIKPKYTALKRVFELENT